MNNIFNVILLAAGKGTRLKSDVPKPLIKALGLPIIDYTLRALNQLDSQDQLFPYIVTGHQRELLESHLESLKKGEEDKVSSLFQKLTPVNQKEQLGTGHAVQCVFNQRNELLERPWTLIMSGDTPLIRSHHIEALIERALNLESCEGLVATFKATNPTGYGRIIHTDDGIKIVEEKDASDLEREIQEVNSGLYLFKTSYLREHLSGLEQNNAQNEFYLTDLFTPKRSVHSLLFQEEKAFCGVNNLKELRQVESHLLEEKLDILQREGVRVLGGPGHIDWDVQVGPGCLLMPQVCLMGKTQIGERTQVGIGSILIDTLIDKDVSILPYSHLEGTRVRSHSTIGPFARLRPEADIHENCRVGNFVEIKKSSIGKGAKVSHLSYVGDAQIGDETNIGCGFISANYDGVQKHQTIIGKSCFIGSGCELIAPIEIGDDCFVAAGSTLTQSVPSESFSIARGKQVNKEKLAKRFLPAKKL